MRSRASERTPPNFVAGKSASSIEREIVGNARYDYTCCGTHLSILSLRMSVVKGFNR